jgi:ComEC/Rec2-related protein
VTFPLKILEMRDLGDGKLITTAPLLLQVHWAGSVPCYGDLVSFQGTPGRPAPPCNPGEMDYRQWLERHGIYTRIEVDPSIPGVIDSSGHGNPLLACAIKARQRMEEILSIDLTGAPEVRGAIEGICLGVTEHAPEGFTDEFRFTGTMHLFAVSGLHVGMLAVILWFILKAFRVPRLPAVFLTIPTLFLYVLVTGMKMGSIRSATMASILLIGLILFRRSPLLNTLASAAFLQLALNTNDLFSAGWQFSYSVVFTIIVFAPIIEAWLIRFHEPDSFLPAKLVSPRENLEFKAWKHLSGLSAVSASAWLGAILPTLAYFHLISLSAFGANLLAVPLSFLVLSLGALSLASGMCSSWIAGAFNNSNWLVTKLLLFVVTSSALVPGGHFFVGAPAWNPEMTLLDLQGSPCAILRDGWSFGLVDAGNKRDAASTVIPCIEAAGANSIQSVLITKNDAAHLGGLPLIKQESSIFSMALPPVDGRSSVAKALLSQEHSASLKRLSEGDRWRLLERIRAETIYPPREKPSDFLMPRLLIGNTRILMLPKMTPEVIKDLSVIPQESLKAEILILPLGGCDFSSTLALIRKVSPRLLISPVDRHSGLGVPSGEWRGILKDEGIGFMRQDETGAVTIVSNKRETAVHPFLKKDQKMILR